MYIINIPDSKFKIAQKLSDGKWKVRLFPSSQNGITRAVEVTTTEKPIAEIRNKLEKEIMEKLRNMVTNSIRIYDNSNELNKFTINELTDTWRADMRLKLTHAVDAEEYGQYETTYLYIQNTPIPVTISQAREVLNQLEIRAISIFRQTSAHIANVNAIEDFHELENYNYKTGYPDNLKFNFQNVQ